MGKTVTYACDGCKKTVDEADRTKETTRLEGPNVDTYRIRDLCPDCTTKVGKGFTPTKHREKKDETAATVTPIEAGKQEAAV